MVRGAERVLDGTPTPCGRAMMTRVNLTSRAAAPMWRSGVEYHMFGGWPMRRQFIAALFVLFPTAGDAYGQPSFSCATDTGPDERTICASPALSQFDRQLNHLYGLVLEALDANRQISLRDAQRNWLRQRAACGTNAGCITGLYQVRISQLQALLAGAPSSESRHTPASRPAVSSSGSGSFIS